MANVNRFRKVPFSQPYLIVKGAADAIDIIKGVWSH